MKIGSKSRLFIGTVGIMLALSVVSAPAMADSDGKSRWCRRTLLSLGIPMASGARDGGNGCCRFLKPQTRTTIMTCFSLYARTDRASMVLGGRVSRRPLGCHAQLYYPRRQRPAHSPPQCAVRRTRNNTGERLPQGPQR